MNVLDELAARLGGAVATGAEAGARYVSDRSETGHSAPLAVVRPGSTEEVAEALRICSRHGVPVVPQGGMTGLAGGANPDVGSIVISLERMRGVEEVDTVAATMTVRAGTPLEEAQNAAAEAGLLLALDLGSRGSCQIGGNLATNAGGNRVIRYGMAREQVLGLEAVLADGTVISSMNRMIKNNAGFDLKHLFIGSEGTLGIITRAVLRLHPAPPSIATALCALPDWKAVLGLLRRAPDKLGPLLAFEAMWRSFVAFNSAALERNFFDHEPEFVVLLETSATQDALEAFLGGMLEEGIITDARVAQSVAQARGFWELREGLPLDSLRNLISFDVGLPAADMDAFAGNCTAAIQARWPDAHVSVFGHVGDGNIHVCVSVIYAPGEGMHDVDAIVYGCLAEFGGSISAEHGIGSLKREWLPVTRSPEEIALMRRIKSALDPQEILNPGKVI